MAGKAKLPHESSVAPERHQRSRCWSMTERPVALTAGTSAARFSLAGDEGDWIFFGEQVYYV
jgi:hypothetical protein